MRDSTHRPTHADASTDSLARYFEEILAYRLLSREEEIALGRRIQAGDAAAVESLVCANLRFVVAIARQYQHRGLSLADLIDEGNLGLIHAAEKFEPDHQSRFVSYAVWWIRQAMRQALAEHAHAVRIPVGRAGEVDRIGRRANQLRQALGREPTRGEMAADLALPEEEVAAGMRLSHVALSLDAPVGDTEGVRLVDVLADERAQTPDDELADGGLTEYLERALGTLREREATVLRLHFGLDGNEPMPLEAIGARLGVTRERVRRIKDRALGRLRRADQGGALASFMEV